MEPNNVSLRSKTLRGLVWQGLGRGGERLARLLANVALARLLSPDDFGLIGVVAAALAAVEAVAFLASEQAIIHSDRGRHCEFLDTAFWLASGRGLIIGVGFLTAAPFAARFFERPDATPLFCVAAMQPFITGLASPRVSLLMKDMRFAIWSTYRFCCSLLGMGATIALAIWLRSAWALLIGQLVMTIILTTGSYVVAPFRPRWRFDADSWRELRTFGLRAAGTPLLLALIFQAPAILLGRGAGLGVLGVFLLSQRLVDIPRDVSLQTIGVVATPAYSSIKADRSRLLRTWLMSLKMIGQISLPLAAILAWVGNDLPRVVYGNEYTGETGLVAMLAAASALSGMLAVTGPLFWGTGLPSYDRTAQFARIIVLYGLGAWLTVRFGGRGLAAAIVAALAVSFVVALVLVRSIIEASWKRICLALLPGCMCAAILLTVLLLSDQIIRSTGWGRLAIGGSVGCPLVAVGLVWSFRDLRARRMKTPPTTAAATEA